MNVTVYSSHIEIQDYPFVCSGIGQDATIYPNDISEVLLTSSPIAIVYQHREIIFLDMDVQEFMNFAQMHQLYQSRRPEIWMELSEHFLNTGQSTKYQLRTLAENNIEAYEVEQIRQRVESTIYAYNELMWESAYLGHYDLLIAYKDCNLPEFTSSLYWWTMEIALKNYVVVGRPTALSDDTAWDNGQY